MRENRFGAWVVEGRGALGERKRRKDKEKNACLVAQRIIPIIL